MNRNLTQAIEMGVGLAPTLIAFLLIIGDMSLQAKLRQARTKAGLSQRELAALAGVPQSTVGRIESGAISPRVETIERLLRALGCELGIEPIEEGGGADRSLIRRFLRLDPLERVLYSAAAGNATLRLRRGLRRDSSDN